MPHTKLTEGDRLYYETHGSGPPLMLVSGLSALAGFRDTHVGPLSESFTVVDHDHRGTGCSEIGRMTYSVEQMAADALARMDHFDIDGAHPRHSTGGVVAAFLRG